MALNISKPTHFGAPATYWRIMSYQVRYDNPSVHCEVQMGGYLSKEARDAGAQPVVTVTVRGDESYRAPQNESELAKADRMLREDAMGTMGTQFNCGKDPTRESIYLALKGSERWGAALDA